MVGDVVGVVRGGVASFGFSKNDDGGNIDTRHYLSIHGEKCDVGLDSVRRKKIGGIILDRNNPKCRIAVG